MQVLQLALQLNRERAHGGVRSLRRGGGVGCFFLMPWVVISSISRYTAVVVAALQRVQVRLERANFTLQLVFFQLEKDTRTSV